MERKDFIKLGEAIRACRKKNGLTIQDVSQKTRLSSGLLSKIENARSVPSLPVLIKIADAINIRLSDLLSQMEKSSTGHYHLVRRSERKNLKRENSTGYSYEAILSQPLADCFFESVILTVEGDTTGKSVTTDGDMYVYCISGVLHLKLGDETIVMQEGDAIYFDGRMPHMSHHKGSGQAIVFLMYFVREAS